MMGRETMAHVLVVEADADVRFTLAMALRDERHRVTSVEDATLALALLRVSRNPLVALLGEWLRPLSGLDILTMVANDESGRLARHGWVLMTTTPERLTLSQRARLQSMAVLALALPCDLNDLMDVVARAERQTHSPQISAAASALAPVTALWINSGSDTTNTDAQEIHAIWSVAPASSRLWERPTIGEGFRGSSA
jgi:DNA-binding NtrC family response regulator